MDKMQLCFLKFISIRYFLYLHFKFYPLSSPETPLSHPSSHSPTLWHRAFIRLRASPLTDVPQVHPLLHMRQEPWVPLCVLFVCWIGPREIWEYWLVHIVVLPMRLQTPLAPWVLSLAPPFGTLCSVQWLADSIHLCMSGTSRAPQETAISGSCQKALVGIHNSVWVW